MWKIEKLTPIQNSMKYCFSLPYSYREYACLDKPKHYSDERCVYDRGLSILQGIYLNGYYNEDPNHPLLRDYYWKENVFSKGYRQKLKDNLKK